MDSRHTRLLTRHSSGEAQHRFSRSCARFIRAAAAIAPAIVASLLMTRLVHADGRPASAVQIATVGNGHGSPACAACHGASGEGNSSLAAPGIAALPPSYVEHQLENFADGKRVSAVMAPIAKSLLPAERSAIVEFYARIPHANAPAPMTAAAENTPASALGQQLALRGRWSQELPACTQCHGRGGVGVDEAFPALAGQPARYLESQLRAWQSGSRDPGPQALMAGIAKKLSDADVEAVAQYFSELPHGSKRAGQSDLAATMSQSRSAGRPRTVSKSPSASRSVREPKQTAFTPPEESDLPSGEFGSMVRLGEQIFVDTRQNAAAFVGNALRCSSCHFDAGRKADSAPLWAAYVAYPEYRAKNHKVNTFEERLQGCFQFSMNGKAPRLGDPVLVALESYAYWLARGAPISRTLPGRGYPKLPKPAMTPDHARGKHVYQQRCALCHVTDGAGRQARGGSMAFPALWGDGSFNWGAGMASVAKAAAFIEANMPLSRPKTLTLQDAWDVAYYMDSHERPQDPRFIESVGATRAKFHDSPDSLYGLNVEGHVLGSGSVKPGGLLRRRPRVKLTSASDR